MKMLLMVVAMIAAMTVAFAQDAKKTETAAPAKADAKVVCTCKKDAKECICKKDDKDCKCADVKCDAPKADAKKAEAPKAEAKK